MAIVLAAFLLVLGGGTTWAVASDRQSLFLVSRHAVAPPTGFSGVCNRYPWACERSARAGKTVGTSSQSVTAVNQQVNRRVRQIEDRHQYGKDDYWALPTARGGDCEDLVLLKKKMLLEHGHPTEALLIATVLDRNLNNHAVLVVRTKSGDLVLDSLTNKIVPWEKTGYTFLKLQNPHALEAWQAVLAGGVIRPGA